MKTDAAAIAAAARCLGEGGLVAFATETVYGLGADAGNGEAVARLYAAKGRPAFNPLIAHVADIAAARHSPASTPRLRRLRQEFWPGPLTLVLPKAEDCGRRSGACRPRNHRRARAAHAVAHALLEAFGGPMVAPSANRSGHVSPTRAAHVLADLRGRIDIVVDGGAARRCGVDDHRLSRRPCPVAAGGVAREEIERLVGQRLGEPRRRPRRAAGARHAGVPLRARSAAAARSGRRASRRSTACLRKRRRKGSLQSVGTRRSGRGRG